MLSSEVLVDYKSKDYRGFIFCIHEAHGLLLLRCTRKKSKGPHWQVPGGHVDEPEFLAAAKQSQDRTTQLLTACRSGAARELFEETGIDLRSQLDRLEPAELRAEPEGDKLSNEYKQRLFFKVNLNDDDFLGQKGNTTPLGQEGKHLKIKLSIEHSGFSFQPEPSEAAEMLKVHSGGKVSEALLMAMNKPGISMTPKRTDNNTSSASSARRKKTDKHPVSPQPPSDEPPAAKAVPRTVPVNLFPPEPERKGCLKCFGFC